MLYSNSPRVPIRLMTDRAELSRVGQGVANTVRFQHFAHTIGRKSLGDAVERDFLSGSEPDPPGVHFHVSPIDEMAGSLEASVIRDSLLRIEFPERLDCRIKRAPVRRDQS